MADKDYLDFLLSEKYRPDESSKDKFGKEYDNLAKCHDGLLEQHEAKERKRALMKKDERQSPRRDTSFKAQS